jgi:hypothetical protein
LIEKVPPDVAISVPTGLPVEVPVQLTLYPLFGPLAVTAIIPLFAVVHVSLVTTVVMMGAAFTNTVIVVGVAHNPAVGVNVYTMLPAVAVEIAEDHVPVIPFSEVVGRVPGVAP